MLSSSLLSGQIQVLVLEIPVCLYKVACSQPLCFSSSLLTLLFSFHLSLHVSFSPLCSEPYPMLLFGLRSLPLGRLWRSYLNKFDKIYSFFFLLNFYSNSMGVKLTHIIGALLLSIPCPSSCFILCLFSVCNSVPFSLAVGLHFIFANFAVLRLRVPRQNTKLLDFPLLCLLNGVD